MESLIREIDAEALPEMLEVEFYGYPKEVESGIGAYEFWGQMGFHSDIEVICEEVFWNEKDYTTTENEIIKQYLDKNYESIATELEEQFT